MQCYAKGDPDNRPVQTKPIISLLPRSIDIANICMPMYIARDPFTCDLFCSPPHCDHFEPFQHATECNGSQKEHNWEKKHHKL